ncbi:hypothetical protein Tco_0913280 [Tanacetum coccineum]
MWSVTSPPSMPLKALSCNIFKNSSSISSLKFVIIALRRIEFTEYAVLSSQNTPYCLGTDTSFRLQKQYAVLSRSLDTPHPTGGYAVSSDQSE